MRIHIKPLKCTCNSRNDFNRNFIHRNLIINVFFLQNDNKLTHTCQKLWREKTIKSGGFPCFRRRSCHSENYQLLFICYHPNLFKKNILRFRIIIYRFHVFQSAGNPSLSIFTLLEPYDAPSPPYIEFTLVRSETPYQLKKKNLSDKLRHKKISQSKTSTRFLH